MENVYELKNVYKTYKNDGKEFTALKDITASDNAATFKVVDFYDYNDGSFEGDSSTVSPGWANS